MAKDKSTRLLRQKARGRRFMLFDDEPFRVAVFGSTYDVRHDGMCTVYWGGQRKTYTRRTKPERESGASGPMVLLALLAFVDLLAARTTHVAASSLWCPSEHQSVALQAFLGQITMDRAEPTLNEALERCHPAAWSAFTHRLGTL